MIINNRFLKIIKFFVPNIIKNKIKELLFNNYNIKSFNDKKIKKLYQWAVENKFYDYDYYKKLYKVSLGPFLTFKYFLFIGYKFNHNPSNTFSTILYYSVRPDLQINFNPLIHYYYYGQYEDNLLLNKIHNKEVDLFGFESPKFEKNFKHGFTTRKIIKELPKIYAFYLPGFHQDKFNDKYWGKGFTEWDNLKKNHKPLFDGHHYPFRPEKYYDLTDTAYIKKQCKLAKKNGIDGFYIFLYDFGHSQYPLFKIIPNLIKVLTAEGLGFCFEWANEPWTRRWDGLENNILIDQPKIPTPLNISRFVNRIHKYVRQKNYLSIDNKKYFSVYRPGYFKDDTSTMSLLKKEFRKYSIEIHLSACNTFSASKSILENPVYDSVTEYPPHPLSDNVDYHFETFKGNTNLWCYKKFILYYINYLRYYKLNKRIFRTVFPSWDNTPRKGKESNLYINCSPVNFTKLLSTAYSDEIKNKFNDKIIFVNSWNEWGEGAHLEPDLDYGYWKLNCISNIKNNFYKSYIHNLNLKKSFNNNNFKIALIHIFRIEHLHFLINLIKKHKKINFFITVPKYVSLDLELIKFDNLILKFVHNEERDFNVLYHAKYLTDIQQYKVISKMHFKNRDQTNGKFITNEESQILIKEELNLLNSINELTKNIFFCRKNWVYSNHLNSLGSNEFFLKKVCSEFKYGYNDVLTNEFITGGIWTIIDNTCAFIDFISKINYEHFQLDDFNNPNDGLYLHSLERITYYHFKQYFFNLEKI